MLYMHQHIFRCDKVMWWCELSKTPRMCHLLRLLRLPLHHTQIIFDDFVTTGSTINSMRNLLQPLGKNLVFFVGINNNM